LLQDIHRRLVTGVRGNRARPGVYRPTQCYVVNSRTGKITYIPPPPAEVPSLMTELVAWLNEEQELHPVLVAGVAQFQFVDIHPFCDGNGRTARLLSTLCLYRKGYDFKQLFTLSEYYDQDRPAYYAAIQSVRQHEHDLTAWLEYFVMGLAAQLEEAQAEGERVMKVQALGERHNLSPRQLAILEGVLEHSRLASNELATLFPNISRRTLQRDLRLLLALNLLTSEGATNQLFYRAGQGLK
jgi:Fic family protein